MQTADRYPIQTVVDHLSSVGVLDRKGIPAFDTIISLPFKQLVNLGAFIAQAGLGREPRPQPEVLFHCASVGLSGGPVPCMEANCRLNQARELARYAIMLSDRVYTYNPFSQFLPTRKGRVEVEESFNFRYEFWAGLRVLTEWAPLIEEGLIFPFPHGDHYCHWCLAKSSFGADAGRRLDRAIATYERRFRRETKVTLEQSEESYTLHITGPQDLIAHGQALMDVEQVPRSLRTPQLLAVLARGRIVPVPPPVARGMRLANSYSGDILHTLRYGLIASQTLGTAYVTDSRAEVDLLSAVSGSRDIAKRNQIAAEHLSTIIPFLPEIPIRALLRLRATEAEAFLRYRAALGKCLSALGNDRPTGLTQNDARSLHGDVIAPELARIQILVRDARRRTISGAGRALLGWGTALTLGVYAGLVPKELLEAAKVLGATGLVKELVSQLAAIKDAEAAVRQESYYFLWQARRLRKGQVDCGRDA